MINVQWIDIIRAEGPIALCGKFNRFETFKKADKFLRESSRTCHPEGGYDKHDVKITWNDGYQYKGRWDVKYDGDDTEIAKHIRQHLTWQINNSEDLKLRKEAQEFLERYKLDD